MQTSICETVSKEVMEKILLRNLELLKAVDERDIAIEALTEQRDIYCTAYLNTKNDLAKLVAALNVGEQNGN